MQTDKANEHLFCSLAAYQHKDGHQQDKILHFYLHPGKAATQICICRCLNRQPDSLKTSKKAYRQIIDCNSFNSDVKEFGYMAHNFIQLFDLSYFLPFSLRFFAHSLLSLPQHSKDYCRRVHCSTHCISCLCFWPDNRDFLS